MRERFRYWIDGIVYRLDLTREAWKAIGIAVGISLIIVAIVLAIVMPRQSTFQDQVDTLSASWAYAVLQNQNTVNQVWDATQNITDLLNLYHAQLIDALGRLATIEDSSTNPHSSANYSLTGAFPDYKLYARPDEAGNFTANVHLVYRPSVGNATSYNQTLTAFYAGINFTATPPVYIPSVTFNGTTWGIAEVWFNIGVYGLDPTAMSIIPIACTGLNLTPSFAYVEVYKI